MLFNMGIVPLINSRKSVKKQNIVKLTEHFYVNMDFVPSTWTKEDLILAIETAENFKLPFSILGGGSKLLVSDNGFEGLIIQIFQIIQIFVIVFKYV